MYNFLSLLGYLRITWNICILPEQQAVREGILDSACLSVCKGNVDATPTVVGAFSSNFQRWTTSTCRRKEFLLRQFLKALSWYNWGFFEFSIMAFVFTNSPASYQRSFEFNMMHFELRLSNSSASLDISLQRVGGYIVNCSRQF